MGRSTTVRGTLLAAARYIETNGWCRHVMRRHDGHVCVLGALEAVAGRGGDVRAAACAVLLAAVGGGMVAAWNDRQRDRRTVVRMLRRVARDA